jgi:hypothetical protein
MATATLSTSVETHSEDYVLLHGVRWSSERRTQTCGDPAEFNRVI